MINPNQEDMGDRSIALLIVNPDQDGFGKINRKQFMSLQFIPMLPLVRFQAPHRNQLKQVSFQILIDSPLFRDGFGIHA